MAKVERTGYTLTIPMDSASWGELLKAGFVPKGDTPPAKREDFPDTLKIQMSDAESLRLDIRDKVSGKPVPITQLTNFAFSLSTRFVLEPDGVHCILPGKAEELVIVPGGAQSWGEWYRPERTLADLLESVKEDKPGPQAQAGLPAGFMGLVNDAVYYGTRDVIARGAFDCGGGNKWPTGRIEQKTVTADVQVRPDPANVEPNLDETALREWQERAARQALAMDDDTADVLDYITSEVIEQKAPRGQDIIFSADRFLEKRGLQKQLSGSGRRGGYKTEYRRDFAAQVGNLSDVWIRVAEMDTVELDGKGKRRRSKRRGLESRAVVVSARAGQISMTGRIEPDTYRGRLGPLFEESIFGPWRDIALVSLKALGYDRYRERPEKRLTRYLSWQWRIRQSTGNYLQPYEVSTLLGAIGLEVSKTDPNRTKDRLETALDALHSDGVIAGWQYCEGWDVDIVGRRGWAAKWQGWKIVIEPPAEIMEQYQRIPHKEPKPQPLAGGKVPMGERIKAARKAEGLTQLRAAEDIGINRATLARIERGANPGPEARKSIATWLDKLNKPNTPQA